MVAKPPVAPVLNASAVATPVPNPLIPVETGNPVAFVKVTDVGVPKMGVTNVGLVVAEIAPVPLRANPSAVPTPVPNPVMPVIGRPVAFVSVTETGVPSAGALSVGPVASTAFPDPVVARPDTTVPVLA
jgi:hypothetical protein